MPELPDIVVYIESLEARIGGKTLQGVRLGSPFVLRTVDPPLKAAVGKTVRGLRRLGKRIAIGLDGDLHLVIHLMIAGRLHWQAAGAKLPGKRGLAAFDFAGGTLILLEAATRKRASLHVVRGDALAEHDPGGLEVLDTDVKTFARALTATNHTLKRALTDPRTFSGIGNAYSDEILHAARLSPIKWTQKLNDEEIARLFDAVRATMTDWTERLRASAGGKFPDKVTAFRPGMAVHGRYREACPVCGSPVQRIAYASNETNYCAKCQTGGKLLADRALSRLMHKDWPKTLEDLEEMRRGHAAGE